LARVATEPSRSPSSVAAWLIESAALFLLLVVVGVRPLVQEDPSTAMASFDRALQTTSHGLDPTFSLLMTLMILTAALLACVGRLLHPRPWRSLGIEAGGALLLVVATASCFFASDRRVAINETANWLALPLLAMVAAQLLDRPRAASLLVAVIVASAATFAFQCIRQVRHEFDDTIASYEEMREKFWADQGIPLDDPQVTLFERRLHGREAFGYASHSNVAGGYLMAAAFVTAAACVSRFAQARGLIWFGLATLNAVIAAGLTWTIWLTRSRGAIAAGIIGAAVLAIAWLLQRRIAARPRLGLAGAWLAVLIGAGAVISYGSARGGLPTSSLEFRWSYWRNSMKLVAEHPWVGVGAGNFPNHYPRVKPVTDPEEVKDPHNFLVTATTQWGIPGGLAVIAMIVGASVTCAAQRTGGEPPPLPSSDAPPQDTDWLRAAGWVALWTAGLAFVIFALRHACIGSADPAEYAYAFDSPRRIWIIAFLLAYVSLPVLDLSGECALTTVGRAVIAAGLAAMLLHACIEMTLSQYGSAVTAFAMLPLLYSSRSTRPASAERPARGIVWMGVAGAAAALAAVVVVAAIPTTRVVWRLTEARQAAQQSASPSTVPAAYDAAVAADELDPAPPGELTSWLMSQVHAGSESAAPMMTRLVEAARLAAERNPASYAGWRLLAAANLLAFERTGDAAAGRAAADAARRSLERYPESPIVLVTVAETLQRVSGAEGERSRIPMLKEALAAYDRALELDAKRSPDEIRRFTESQRAAILARRDALRASLGGSAENGAH
jgi:O-antigen ligase